MLCLRRRTRAEIAASGDARCVEFTLHGLDDRAQALRRQHEHLAAILAGEAPALPCPRRPRPPERAIRRDAWDAENDYFVDCATQVTLKWISEHSCEARVPRPEALRQAMGRYMYRTSASRFRGFELLK